MFRSLEKRMIDRSNSVSHEYVDQDVREAYRRTAVETTPVCLDSHILHLSRQASRKRSETSKTDSWARPLAFAAMAVLSLAAVLQFLGVGVVEIAPELPAGAVSEQHGRSGNQAGDLSAAVESTGQRLRDLDNGAESLTSNNKPMPTAVPHSGNGLDSSGQTGVAVSDQCVSESKISADSWWRCIQDLQQDGLDDAARDELDLFYTAYPEFDAKR